MRCEVFQAEDGAGVLLFLAWFGKTLATDALWR